MMPASARLVVTEARKPTAESDEGTSRVTQVQDMSSFRPVASAWGRVVMTGIPAEDCQESHQLMHGY